MKRSRLLAVLPAALLLLVAANHHQPHRVLQRVAAGDVVQDPAIQGTFVYTAQGSDDIETVIRNGTAKMNFIKRPIARSRLKKTNLPYQTIRIEETPAQVSIISDHRAPIVTPADGKSIKWRREDGELFDVNTVREQGKLKQTFVAEDGSRENLYSLSPDGETLTMQVTIRSGQLPAPIVYKLDFKRKA